MIDLHIHTIHSSDGQYAPEEILALAQRRGIDALAFCDHMDISAAREGCGIFPGSGIEFFTGVELSTAWKGSEYHLLCYGFDPDGSVISDFIETHCSRIWGKMDAILGYFHGMGFRLQAEDIRGWGRSVPTGVTMLKALVASNPDDERIRRYTHGDRSGSPYLNFYQDFSLTGFGREISSWLPDLLETSEAFRKCGVLVLAHPGRIRAETLEELKVHGLEGIEVYSSHHGEEETRHLEGLARSLGLLVSAGSDFHGEMIKPDIALGSVQGSPDTALVEAIRASSAAWRR